MLRTTKETVKEILTAIVAKAEKETTWEHGDFLKVKEKYITLNFTEEAVNILKKILKEYE